MSDLDKEKTADEMFEGLGYEKEEITQNEIDNLRYTKLYQRDSFEFLKSIEINNPKIYSYPFIRTTKIFILVEKYESFDISIEELKAINKKCQELGWI